MGDGNQSRVLWKSGIEVSPQPSQLSCYLGLLDFFLTDASELREKQLNRETVELGKHRLRTELHAEGSYGSLWPH